MSSPLRARVHVPACVAALLLCGGPAAADGMPKKVAYVAPVATWTGCYVGTDGGYKWGHNRLEVPTTYTLNNPGGRNNPAPFDVARLIVTPNTPSGDGSSETAHTNGGLWGVQGGCNYHLKTGLVVGIEISGTLDRAKDTIVQDLVTAAGRVPVTTLTTEIERRCQFRLGPRLGSTFPGLTGQNRTTDLPPLFYATGGYAGTCYRTRQSGSNPNFRANVSNPDVSESDFISGWYVGGGIDIPTTFLMPNTFVQIELTHAEYGDTSFRLAGSDESGRFSNSSNEIRIGFKYRFPTGPNIPQ
jgi:outer membrane immunogenic protein